MPNHFSEVAIGIRLRGKLCYSDFFLSLLTVDKAPGTRIIPPQSYGAVQAAQDIFRRFLNGGKEKFLWLLDEDATLPQLALRRLLDRDLPVVGALTWTKGFPPIPTIFRGRTRALSTEKYEYYLPRVDDVVKMYEDPEITKELIEHQLDDAFCLKRTEGMLSRTDTIGFHCVLIRRDVLEKIGEPYCEGSELGVHEDFDFSERVIRAGYDIYVDKSVIVGHIIPHAIRPVDFYLWHAAVTSDQEAAEQEAKNGKKPVP